MHGNDRYRAVLIIHPDFQEPGPDGILSAKSFAESLIETQKNFLIEAQKKRPINIQIEMKKYFEKMRVVVRNIPKDLI
jgi:hypothetical protein